MRTILWLDRRSDIIQYSLENGWSIRNKHDPYRAKCGVRRISANAQVNIVTLNIPEAYGRTPWRKSLDDSW